LFNKLTRLQKRVAIGVLGGLSQTAAYRQAGGKAKSEDAEYACASRMLSNVKVSAFLDSVEQARAIHTIMGREEALERLTAIARFNPNEVCDFVNGKWAVKADLVLTDEQAYCLKELGQKVKWKSQMDGLRALRAMEGWDSATKFEHVVEESSLISDHDKDVIDVARRLLHLFNKGVAAIDRVAALKKTDERAKK
jgi:hypothetical protein